MSSQTIFLHLHLYAFNRYFYPKRLTVHSGYTFFYQYLCFLGAEPTTVFVLLTQCSTTEQQKHGYKSGLQSHSVCKFNRVHVNESNTGAAFYTLSATFNIRDRNRRVRHQHWKDRLVSLLLMKIIVCWASATYFQFNSRQFAHRLAEDPAKKK